MLSMQGNPNQQELETFEDNNEGGYVQGDCTVSSLSSDQAVTIEQDIKHKR